MRESRGSRPGRGGAIVLSRNSLLFQRHATDRSRQEEQSRVPGTRGIVYTKKKKKKRNSQEFYNNFLTVLKYRHVVASQVGLHKFLPRSVLNGMKPKALRKLIQQHFKKVAVLSELECMFKFFDLLRAHYRFDQERFICALGVRFNFQIDSINSFQLLF